jgi:intraflagellar transport protein 81
MATEAPPSDQDMITFIVDELNSILTRDYTLVDFDDLPAVRLLAVLSDLFAQLSPAAAVDFTAGEPHEVGAMKLMEFLGKTLGYKVPQLIQHTFHNDFVAAEKTVMYPIFYWMLKRMPENRKRVYLAKYLSRIDVPEDLRMQDDGIREVYERYEQARADFILVHKRVDALKEASADPAETRKRISAMEAERDNLAQLIGATQRKLSSLSNKDALLSACKVLRAQQEDQAKLTDKEHALEAQGKASRLRAADVTNRLREVRRDIQEHRIEAIVQRMSDDLRANKMKLEEQLPQELGEKRVQNAALQKLVTETLDLPSLHAEMGDLDKQCTALAAQVAERQRPSDDGSNIVMMKQQLQRVMKKKNEGLAELGQLKELQQTHLASIQDREGQLEGFKKSKILKGEDFRRYANQVRQKVAASKHLKTKLEDLRGELGVLQYTERLLRKKNEELDGDLSELEAKLGARGYVQKAEHLTSLAAEKNAVEQVKGSTLEELSVVVQQLVSTISERRERLAPHILQLRTARNNSQVIEQEWEDKKSAYEFQQGNLMQEVNKLDGEVGVLTEETHLSESMYHRMHSQMQIVAVQQQRVEDEKEYRAGGKTLDATTKSYAQMYHATTEDVENRARTLQKRRRDIDDNHDGRLQQVEWFAQLRRLLESKVQVMRNDDGSNAAARPGQTIDQDIQAIMMTQQNQPRGGHDILVLGNN